MIKYTHYTGTCDCNNGLAGADCSLPSNASPVVSSMPMAGLCDSRFDDCTVAILFGDNFIQDNDTYCYVQEAQVFHSYFLTELLDSIPLCTCMYILYLYPLCVFCKC